VATSGTVGLTQINVAKIIEHAARRCKLPSSQITGEVLEIGRDALYFYTSALANRGISLWTIKRRILGQYLNQASMPLPRGIVDVLNVNARTLARQQYGNPGSSAGGTASFAFDEDIDTWCQQTSANGNISYEFASSTTVTSVGFMPYGDLDLTPVVEFTVDGGVTWETYFTPPPDPDSTSIAMTDKTWYWWDITRPASATGLRWRETGGATLACRELFFGNTPSETPMARLNRDDYSSLPNKVQANPPRQFWVDRLVDAPTLYLWPVPNNNFDQVVMFTHSQIEDVGSLTDTISAPQRWIEALITNCASRLSLELANVDEARIALLDQMAQRATYEAEQEERDNSPIYYVPGISVYTR